MGRKQNAGFTLIELSIVLVIIGLIVGGVLVGQDLIKAAEVRAQITQIEKYNTAVNTFRIKFGYLPGDIPDPAASSIGFQPRGQYAGEGDGNGLIEGTDGANNVDDVVEGGGETVMFWRDLSDAQLLNSAFHTASSTTVPHAPIAALLLPAAKIGPPNYVYVYARSGINYYGLSAANNNGGIDESGNVPGNPDLSPLQALAIDQKIDDGFPQTGRVTALYVWMGSVYWAIAEGVPGRQGAGDTSATPGTGITCYDNNSTAGAIQHYSTEINNGAGTNCALSFQFQ